MGCGASTGVDSLDYVRDRFPRTLAFLELQQHSRELANLFAMHDKNGNQRLSVTEFFSLCKISDTRASRRLFSICDVDGSGNLDFREMLFTIWNLCTLDSAGLSHLLFDLYDEDTDGSIDVEDMKRLMEDTYGPGFASKREIQSALKKLESVGPMDREQFAAQCAKTPQVMKQVIDMQRRVQDQVINVRVWHNLTRRRQAKPDPVFRPDNWHELMQRIIMMDVVARKANSAYDESEERVAAEIAAAQRAARVEAEAAAKAKAEAEAASASGSAESADGSGSLGSSRRDSARGKERKKEKEMKTRPNKVAPASRRALPPSALQPSGASTPMASRR